MLAVQSTFELVEHARLLEDATAERGVDRPGLVDEHDQAKHEQRREHLGPPRSEHQAVHHLRELAQVAALFGDVGVRQVSAISTVNARGE